jgi:PPK2 family polyphosphate:nucleotide phosphotransferase
MPDLEARFRVAPGRLALADHDPGDTAGLERERAGELLETGVERLRELQGDLYAEGRQALLVVLQGLDASGKDGAIAHVMSGVNPLAVQATAFKAPSETELAHDWLWRHVTALPERGHIGIFNRSHYEEVVVVRVRPEQLAAEGADPSQAGDERLWAGRLDAIAAWERHLGACATRVVKLFLNVSKDEQRKRLLERGKDPAKIWKFSPDDVAQRAYWDDYQRAYEQALRATSTADAPWYVIPADHKWFARAAVAQIVVHHLEQMRPRRPELTDEQRRAADEALRRLEAE